MYAVGVCVLSFLECVLPIIPKQTTVYCRETENVCCYDYEGCEIRLVHVNVESNFVEFELRLSFIIKGYVRTVCHERKVSFFSLLDRWRRRGRLSPPQRP